MQIPYLRHLREIAEAQEVGCPFWLSFITVISQAHTSWLLSRTKILSTQLSQRQGYAEQHTTYSSNNYIYMKNGNSTH